MDTPTRTETHCKAIELTMPWTDEQGRLNIVKGDLIAEFGIGFALVSDVDLIEGGRVVRYEIDGQLGIEFAGPKDEVTVFRYIETCEASDRG